MSDIEKTKLNNAPDMYVHYCEEDGCNEWGGYGFSPSKAVPARWWCWPHYPHKNYEQEKALRQKLEAAEKGPTQ